MKKILVLSGLGLWLLGGCAHRPEKKEDKGLFILTSPMQTDTFLLREYVSQVKAISHIEIRALEKGYLQKIYVDEGQKIQKGQLMFQILPVMYQAEKEKAQAEARFAEIEYLNTRQLAEKNVVSPNELAMAKARLDKAKAELAVAQAHLNFTEIRAPFDGIMDRFQVRLGSLLNEGDLLTTLSDNSRMWVYFNVPEAEYLDYKTHVRHDSLIKVRLKMANGQEFPYGGRVETIEADFNNETGNIAFRAAFPNPEGLLRHGETGNVLIRAPFQNALLIPQKATFEVLEKKFVFVVDAAGIARQKEIAIAGEMPDLYLVQSGLKPGEKIILEGIRKVRHGDKVEHSRYLKPDSVFPSLNVYVE